MRQSLGLTLGLLAVMAAPAAALEECTYHGGSSWEIALPAGRDEARCSFGLEEPARIAPHSLSVKFSSTNSSDSGPLEAEIVATIAGLETRGTPDSPWSEAWGLNVVGTGASLGLEVDGVPLPGVDRWRHSDLFLIEREFRVGLRQAGWYFPDSLEGQLRAQLDFELIVRRVQGGCWTAGWVKGEQVSGDYAFWSDNPTGLLVEEEDIPVATQEEAQDSIQAIGNLDPQALAKLGLDLAQVQGAVAAAQKAEALGSVSALPETESLLDELAQFDGHTFLTLQSVKGDDDVELLGGKPAGIAGDLSAAELAQGVAHILSKFSLTLELGVDFDELGPEKLKELWGKALPVERAGLGHRGLKYTWPRDGGPTPLVKLGKCADGLAGEGAVCGRVSWSGVVQALFRAGPGVFSCINN